uniref:SCAN box domain-containing protein n=1 Tax=Xenopus tropicalis TaxID=8364 RepID=A0A803JRY0_XENTR
MGKKKAWRESPKITQKQKPGEKGNIRQRFRAYRYSNSDGPCEAYAQLHELLLKWIQPERKTGEQILEMIDRTIALEQFIEILPDKVKLWVQEHRPETSTKAISLAEDFLLARRETEQRVTVGSGATCCSPTPCLLLSVPPKQVVIFEFLTWWQVLVGDPCSRPWKSKMPQLWEIWTYCEILP